MSNEIANFPQHCYEVLALQFRHDRPHQVTIGSDSIPQPPNARNIHVPDRVVCPRRPIRRTWNSSSGSASAARDPRLSISEHDNAGGVPQPLHRRSLRSTSRTRRVQRRRRRSDISAATPHIPRPDADGTATVKSLTNCSVPPPKPVPVTAVIPTNPVGPPSRDASDPTK